MTEKNTEDKNRPTDIEKDILGQCERSGDVLTATKVVDFEYGDPEDPFNWPTWRKWTIVSLVTVTLFLG